MRSGVRIHEAVIGWFPGPEVADMIVLERRRAFGIFLDLTTPDRKLELPTLKVGKSGEFIFQYSKYRCEDSEIPLRFSRPRFPRKGGQIV
jgi:hypothetical protein